MNGIVSLKFMINGIILILKSLSSTLLWDVSRSPSYDVYISQLIRFERVRSNVSGCLQSHWGLPVGFLLLWYSVVCTDESLSLLYLLFIS